MPYWSTVCSNRMQVRLYHNIRLAHGEYAFPHIDDGAAASVPPPVHSVNGYAQARAQDLRKTQSRVRHR
jgi:hypothetical protein